MEETKKTSGKGLYLLLILLLLGANAWLFYNAYKNKEEQKVFQNQISEKDSLINSLNTQYTNALLELQAQKGESAQKDSLIAQLQNDLSARRNEIADILKSKNFYNKKSSEIQKLLDDANAQIALLQVEREQNITKLDSVTQAYNTLLGDYESLEINLTEQTQRGDMLVQQKDSIQNLGSIIMASNISVSGVRSKGNGKEVEDQNSKKTDRLKICFSLLENKLAAGTNQTVYVKIIDPAGLTLYDSGTGSGEFINKENSEDSRYTTSVSMNYKGEDEQSYCVYWNQQNEFAPGDYTVMIYNQGYCVGKNHFSLKKSIF